MSKKKSIWFRLQKWFDLNFSWFFTNGNKQDLNRQRLENKYDKI